ncbi:MAG: hypothetical protein P8R54_32635 [Myxococcota bacterium]|nr:hypothetical protein [Myxococcota bacterium]
MPQRIGPVIDAATPESTRSSRSEAAHADAGEDAVFADEGHNRRHRMLLNGAAGGGRWSAGMPQQDRRIPHAAPL